MRSINSAATAVSDHELEVYNGAPGYKLHRHPGTNTVVMYASEDQGRVGGSLMWAKRSEEHVVVLCWQRSLSLAHVHLHEIIVALPEPGRCCACGWVCEGVDKGACWGGSMCVRVYVHVHGRGCEWNLGMGV